MSETAQNQENNNQEYNPVIIGSSGTGTAAAIAVVLFNADAEQRFEFFVMENGEKYETAHFYQPLTDERFLEFIKAFDIRGDENNVSHQQLEETEKLWNELCSAVENIEVEEGENWQDLIDVKEKEDSLNNFLAVAIVEPETASSGKRKLSKNNNQTIITESYFNGIPVQQTHKLLAKSTEWQKKYDRIESKRFEADKTKGLRTSPKMKYVPQDEKIAALYDEMLIESDGFANDKIPVRFKTKVIHYIFASKIEGKK